MSKTQDQQRLDRCLAKRANLFQRAQLCFDDGQALEKNPNDATKLKNFSIRYSTFSKTAQEFYEIVQEIVELKQSINPEAPISYSSLDGFEDLYSNIQYFATTLIPTPTTSAINNPPPNNTSRVHMPKIELIKFDGEDLTIWPIFHENFKHLIHSKTEFSRAEKLQYLLGSLTGKALRTCSAIESIPNNYDIIWKLLEQTYNDTKFLAHLYFDRLLNYRALSNNHPTGLQTFLERFDTNVTSLHRLKLADLGDYMLTHIAMTKLSSETINSFELVRASTDLPKYDELIKFVRQQSRIAIKTENPKLAPNTSISNKRYSYTPPRSPKSFLTGESGWKNTCVACHKGSHFLKDCHEFKNTLSFDQKFKIVKDNNLCLNCFSSKHRVASCPSKFSCLKCKSKHHTILHKNEVSVDSKNYSSMTTGTEDQPNNQGNSQNFNSTEPLHSLCTNVNMKVHGSSHIILLSTALVKVYDRWNKEHNIRVLIDSGSMSNLLTLECCRKLGLSYSKLNSNIFGVGGTSKPLKGRTCLTIHSNINPTVKYPIEVLLVDKITNALPDVNIATYSSELEHLKNLPLADPNFCTSGVIDGILGASLFAEIMGTRKIFGRVGSPTAMETTFGYIVIGRAPIHDNVVPQQTFCLFQNLDSLVEKMWEIEDFSSPVKSQEDEICEKLFSENVSRDSDGRYTVALPFKENPSKLGNSYFLAKNRFLSLESRLIKFPKLRETYFSIIKDYMDQGHLSPICIKNIDVPSYYIPHHCIFKLDSISTPCRIVFDASMKTQNNLSLNDILHTGPKLQNNPVTILLNFRLFPVAITSDLKQMYRQIKVIDKHKPFQRILWRFDQNDPISIYEINRVVFGVKASPFLSLRTVRQLAQDESKLYPEAVVLVNRDMYMDDLVSSVPSDDKALSIHSQMVKLFLSGGFQMVKWMSNSKYFLSQINESLKLAATIEFDKSSLKVLGLQWDPFQDIFTYKIDIKPTPGTKRNILSLVARTFDPLGFLAPLTLCLKILIKRLWDLRIDWDQPAPYEISKMWDKIQNEFSELSSISIPRHLFVFENTKLSLIGFADASTVGYAAVVYSLAKDSTTGKTSVSLLCARSKVAPAAKVTLPRLELCAAALLAKLMSHIRDVYAPRHDIDKIYAFSDSMITLSWIYGTPNKFKTFISNRISQIQTCLSSSHWYFIPGKQNVSDCASRGLTPHELLIHPSWFVGPPWLLYDPSDWPIKSITSNEIKISEQEISVFLVSEVIISPLYSLIEYFSSWSKLLNATVYVLRFIKVLPLKRRIEKSDLDKAELTLLRVVQQRHFGEEYKLLSENKTLKSPLRRLNPFIKNGIIRVGGRLANSNILFEHKHPILLPKSDPLVELLIDYNHRRHCHTGAHLLQSILQQNYWILTARNIIRKRIWKCNHCFKLHPKPTYPIMADLPSERVNQATKAFLCTGVDYTGAFLITMGRHRGIKSQKAYVCLFICLATKAIHLELASGLSTEIFLAAFKRFISRRGNCTTLFSDRGTNFIGAKSQLDEVYKFVETRDFQDALQKDLNFQKINFRYNPAAASHFGGLWESNIKSVKAHLARVIGNQILSYEEFTTVLAQIEALLNSRPLCCLSSDPNDPVALTPAHFLYGSPLSSLPVEPLIENINPVNRFKLLDSLIQHYWKRWHTEYLSTMQARQKWNSPSKPVTEGTIVIIIYENIPPLQWPLGIIEKVYPGKDGIVRVAVVRTRNNTYTRPVAKLCPLPTQ